MLQTDGSLYPTVDDLLNSKVLGCRLLSEISDKMILLILGINPSFIPNAMILSTNDPAVVIGLLVIVLFLVSPLDKM